MSNNTVPSGAPHAAGWQSGLKTALAGRWGNVALVAGLAIALGLMLPKLLPSDPVVVPESDGQQKGMTKGAGVGKGEIARLNTSAYANNTDLVGRLFFGTIVVLGLSVGSIWGMRRWQLGKGPAGAAGRELRLVETLHLGNRTSLHLVHLGKQAILVGADGGGIKSIVPLPKPFDDALAEIAGADPAPGDADNAAREIGVPREWPNAA